MAATWPAHGSPAWDTTLKAYLDANTQSVITPEFYDSTAGTGGNDTAAIQSCIDSGEVVWLTPGKVYLAAGLVPRSGMVMTGGTGINFGRMTPYTASLRAYGTGDVFIAPASPGCYGFRFADIVFDTTTTSGTLFRGFWSQGSFSNVTWFQNNPAKSIFDISGFIDVTFEGQCNMYHVDTSTVPAFNAVDSTGNLAQVHFGKMRCQHTGVYFFHIEGTLGALPVNFDFRNVTFEQCNGLVRMLSCRHFTLSNIGDWDHTTAQTLHPFYIGKSATAGALSPAKITFDNCMRDASTAPGAGVYDIFVDPAAGMAELQILNCGHQQLGAYNVTCGGSTGTIRGSNPTAINATNMTTDVWQAVTGTLGGSGTAVGNGTMVARMRRTGASVEYRLKFTLGSTSTIGSQVLVNLPATADVTSGVAGVRALASDTGINSYSLAAQLSSSTTVVLNTAGTNGLIGSVSTTNPFTWGTGDVLEVGVIYESA